MKSTICRIICEVNISIRSPKDLSKLGKNEEFRAAMRYYQCRLWTA